MNMRSRFMQFMVGRNGMDAMAKCFLWLSVILLVITMITHQGLIYLLAMASIIYSYFRMMSKNVSKRYYENQKYLYHTEKIRKVFGNWKNKIKYQISKMSYDMNQRKQYKIFRCPTCKQKIRAPKGRGKIEITCQKCSCKFIKRT